LLVHPVSPLAFHLIYVLTLFMGAVKNIALTKKRGRGRPRKEDPIRTLVHVALSVTSAERFAKWMEKNGISSRSEAGRFLIEQALAAAESPSTASKPRRPSSKK
jgi:hypothetical protein